MTILVIDIGSSSVRAMLYDEQANPNPHAIVQHAYQFDYDRTGRATVKADYLRNIVEKSIAQLLQNPDSNRIQAVGISTFASSIMGLDADNQPVTELLTYADTRSHGVINTLKSHFDENDILQRTGCRLHPAYSSVQLYWMKQQYPEIFSQVHRWLDFGSYLYLNWFGAARTSYSIASWSGLLNRETLFWDDQWLEILGITPENLSQLADVYDTFSGSPFNRSWKAVDGVPFYLAGGDGALANVGSGAIYDHVASLTVGSTSAIRIMRANPLRPVPNGMWSYRVTKSQHLVGGAMTEGGTSFAWGKSNLSVTQDQIDALSTMRPDSHGLTVLPLFAGERSPNWTAHATATIHGLQLSTQPVQILQAIMESVTYRLADLADSLLAVDAQIMVNGGAINASPVWTQMIANSLNRSLHHVVGEMSARGVATIILSDLYQRDWSEFAPTVERTFRPQRDIVPIYENARMRQRELYQQIYGES